MTTTDGDFGERIKKSFDFLQDATKQLITLATAILTFTITFLKDLAETAGDVPRLVLTISWILLVVSAGAGLAVLLNLSGLLATTTETPTIYKSSVRLFALIQLGAFGLALVAALLFAITW